MTQQDQKQLGRTLWNIADQLRGAMSADDFRDYMLSFLFLRYLSDNYVEAVKKELGSDYPVPAADGKRIPVQIWYDENPDDIADFENQMRLKVHYVIEPPYLWSNIAEMARTQHEDLLNTLQAGFKYIENESFESTFNGIFSEINLGSEKLGKDYTARNKKLTRIIAEIAKGLDAFSTDKDTLGDAYEYLIGQFAAGSGKKAGEFYTPQQISDILSAIVTLDSQEPKTGKRDKLNNGIGVTSSLFTLTGERIRGSGVIHWRRMSRDKISLRSPERGIVSFLAILSAADTANPVGFHTGSFLSFESKVHFAQSSIWF